MKELGRIDFAFDHVADGIFYYRLSIVIGEQRRIVLLPRYHALLGWIEVMGMPPQHEWVVLGDVPDFQKTATLTIDEQPIAEAVQYQHDTAAKTHTITTTRTHQDTAEVCVWQQQYADDILKNSTTFTSPHGEYRATWATEFLAPDALPDTINETARDFIETAIATHDTPDHVIHKPFVANGALPPLYYHFFPLGEIVDVSDCTGSVIEVGYLNTSSEHAVDQTHGDWHKLFTINDRTFCITETGYGSRTVDVDEQSLRIKDTYQKILYEV